MSKCERCGLPQWTYDGSKQEFGTCMAHLDQTEPEEIIACRDRELAKLRPTPERFYRWWATLTQEQRIHCWYDLDAMAHPEVVANLRQKLAASERENEAWRALAGNRVAGYGSEMSARGEEDTDSFEYVFGAEHRGTGNWIEVTSGSKQNAAVYLATKPDLLDKGEGRIVALSSNSKGGFVGDGMARGPVLYPGGKTDG